MALAHVSLNQASEPSDSRENLKAALTAITAESEAAAKLPSASDATGRPIWLTV